MNYGKTDKNAVRQKILADRRRREEKDGKWDPSVGQHWIRILPPWAGSTFWWLEYRVHYRILENVSEDEHRWLICLRTYKKPCFACEVVRSMWDEANTETDVTKQEAIRKRASQIGSKVRYMCNIVTKQEPGKPIAWDFGDKVFPQLGSIVSPVVEDDGANAEPVFFPIEDPDHGYSLLATVSSMKGRDGMSYKTINVALPPNAQPKPLPDKSVLNKIPNLSKWLEEHTKSYEEQRVLLNYTQDPAPGEPEQVAEAETVAETEIPEEAPPEEVMAEETPVMEEEPAPPPQPAPKPIAKPVTKVPATGGNNAAKPQSASVTEKARQALRQSNAGR